MLVRRPASFSIVQSSLSTSVGPLWMCAVRVRGSSEIKRLSSPDRELSLLSAMEDTGVLSLDEWEVLLSPKKLGKRRGMW